MLKKVFKCAKDNTRDFSYSLNCIEVYVKLGGYGSWHDSWFAKASVGASTLVLVEETDSKLFSPDDSDQDNYTQDTTPTMPRHGLSALLFVDGHADSTRFFDATKMTYFTYKMAAWEPPASG